MNCNHPKAARAIRTLADGSLVTECWACEVQEKRRPTPIGQILSGMNFRAVTEETREDRDPGRTRADGAS